MLRIVLLIILSLLLLYFINYKFNTIEGAATMGESSGSDSNSNCHYKAINAKMRDLNKRVEENAKNISKMMDSIGKITQ